jgi:hypothetical protein
MDCFTPHKGINEYLATKLFMNKTAFMIVFFISLFMAGHSVLAQNPPNWTAKQLMDPADLAATITDQKDVPLVLSVGPGVTIPNSIGLGMANSDEGLKKLEARLESVDKNQKIVIYCGCCPFEHCPNVRPALDVLKKMGFTNYFLLNLPHNIKQDWIDKGYPVNKS